MKPEHYRFVNAHFELQRYHRYNGGTYVQSALLITDVNHIQLERRFDSHELIAYCRDGRTLTLFHKIPTFKIATVVLEFIEDTRILFV